MLGELGDQDGRLQAAVGDAALDRQTRLQRMDDGIAAAAYQLGAHMADHPETGRHELQWLCHLLTLRPQPGQASAGGA